MRKQIWHPVYLFKVGNFETIELCSLRSSKNFADGPCNSVTVQQCHSVQDTVPLQKSRSIVEKCDFLHIFLR